MKSPISITSFSAVAPDHSPAAPEILDWSQVAGGGRSRIRCPESDVDQTALTGLTHISQCAISVPQGNTPPFNSGMSAEDVIALGQPVVTLGTADGVSAGAEVGSELVPVTYGPTDDVYLACWADDE